MRLRLSALSIPAILCVATAARAEECPHMRPTDPGGYLGFAYGDAPSKFFDTPEGNVRVHWVEVVPHAPSLVSSRTDGVPDAVARAGAILEESIAGFAKLGYRKAPSDGDYATCATNGGDGRLDLYLVQMKGADGLATSERCVTNVCTGAILAENAYDGRGYANYDEGARTVLPHEYFHLIQNGYDARVDRWFAEGSAQWATKQLHPELGDLERFLPAFFAELDRPIDAPPGGVTNGFLYGSAIFPTFLGEAFAPEVVREVHEQLGANAGRVLTATSSVLAARGTSLADAFATFASWNAATGSRAGEYGYAGAATYPEAKIIDAGAAPFRVDAVFAGLSARYYRVNGAARLSLEGAAERVVALAMPADKPDPRNAVRLPTQTDGDSIVVVVGQSVLKTDAPYALIGAPPEVVVDAGPAPAPSEPEQASDASGCTWSMAPSGSGSVALLAAAVVAAARRRRTKPA